MAIDPTIYDTSRTHFHLGRIPCHMETNRMLFYAVTKPNSHLDRSRLYKTIDHTTTYY